MRTARTVTIAAVAAVAIGLNALVPTAFAQTPPQPPAAPGLQMPGNGPGMQMPGGPGMMRQGHPGMRMMMPGMRPGMRSFMANRMNGGGANFLELGCSPRAAEALEVGLVHLSYRLGLTDAQKPAFDKLKTDALAAQASYADSCKTLLPQPGSGQQAGGQPPDPIQRLQDRLKLDQARIDAVGKLIPDLQALYATLTDAQKAQLQPRAMMRQGMPGMRPGMGWNRHGPGRNRPGTDNTATPANPSSV
jgi:hypothetical protein